MDIITVNHRFVFMATDFDLFVFMVKGLDECLRMVYESDNKYL